MVDMIGVSPDQGLIKLIKWSIFFLEATQQSTEDERSDSIILLVMLLILLQ